MDKWKMVTCAIDSYFPTYSTVFRLSTGQYLLTGTHMNDVHLD